MAQRRGAPLYTVRALSCVKYKDDILVSLSLGYCTFSSSFVREYRTTSLRLQSHTVTFVYYIYKDKRMQHRMPVPCISTLFFFYKFGHSGPLSILLILFCTVLPRVYIERKNGQPLGDLFVVDVRSREARLWLQSFLALTNVVQLTA